MRLLANCLASSARRSCVRCFISAPQRPPPPPPQRQKDRRPVPPLLRRSVYNLPNALSAARLAAAPALAYLVVAGDYTSGLWVFGFAGVTDLFDGLLARALDQKTVLGSVLDPLADKTLMTLLTVSLGYAGLLPVWLAVLIVGRDVVLVARSMRQRYVMLPAPKTWARYWDTSVRSAEITPTAISKVNTFLQFSLMGATLGAASYFPVIAPFLPWCNAVVGVTTVWSGMGYFLARTRDVVREVK